jgi:septation ring formation regulator EzrA
MNPDPDKPWMSYHDVVEDLVRPPLREMSQIAEKQFFEIHEAVRSLRSEQRGSGEELSALRADHRRLAEELSGLRAEHLRSAGELTGLRAEHRQAAAQAADLVRRLHVNHLGSTAEAQGALARELREALDGLRRDQGQARERSFTLERRLTDLQAVAGRRGPVWILTVVSGATLVLVVADILSRLS